MSNLPIPAHGLDYLMTSNQIAWATYKLSNGEINADTYALLTADLPTKENN